MPEALSRFSSNPYNAQHIAQYSVSTFGGIMGISVRDVVAFSQARANLSDLAEQVKAGAEKIITKNGESYVALIDSDRLDYYHRLEREHIHLLLIDEASIGLDDVAAGRVEDARQTIQRLKRKRAA
jgi:prevent-host-death family protein